MYIFFLAKLIPFVFSHSVEPKNVYHLANVAMNMPMKKEKSKKKGENQNDYLLQEAAANL
jgi:hypothetical protein